jgi:hypothetical protein
MVNGGNVGNPPRPGKSKWGMNSRVYFIAVSSKKHYH